MQQSLFFYYNCIMIEAKTAAFNFTSYQIPRISFIEPSDPNTTLSLEFEPSGRYIQKDGSFELQLIVSAHEGEEKEKEVLSLTCVAFFKFENDLPFDQIPNYFYKNAIAIVFPFLRSFISTLTLQANCGLIILGLMNLSNLEVPFIKNTIAE